MTSTDGLIETIGSNSWVVL